MQLTDYTTYDDIRATLGVEEAELEDSVISAAIIADTVAQQVYDIFNTFEDRHAELAANNSRNILEARMFSCMNSYIGYCAATVMLRSANKWSFLSTTDGKTTFQRNAADPEYVQTLQATQRYYQKKVINLYASLYPGDTVNDPAVATPVSLRLIGSAGLAVDPVTNT